MAADDAVAAKQLIVSSAINVNIFVDEKVWSPLLMEVLTIYSNRGSDGWFELLGWLLEKGANPNLYCKGGYNCLHVAVQQPQLVRTMTLFLDHGAEVNIQDNNGANVLYWAIQAFPWRTAGEERQSFLNVLERILLAGGDLDMANRHGITPRKWLQRAPQEVVELVARCEALHPKIQAVTTDQPEFPHNLLYPGIARKIWKELVPPTGYADTVQGELVRVIEKLRDEAQRNGNANFQKEHKQMAVFMEDTLVKSKFFDEQTISHIKSAVAKLKKSTRPYTEDDLYDFLTDQACIFYTKQPALLPFKAPK